MSKFIDNVNKYLVAKKIKTYISLKSGIETNKLSRIIICKSQQLVIWKK